MSRQFRSMNREKYFSRVIYSLFFCLLEASRVLIGSQRGHQTPGTTDFIFCSHFNQSTFAFFNFSHF